MAIKFGIPGDVGSFSEEAALLYTKQDSVAISFMYLLDMDGVLSAIEKQEIDLGILPVVNLQGGLVQPALQAMGKHLFTPIDEIWLHVYQSLLVIPGTLAHQITNIVSHAQSFAQCKDYLRKEFQDIALIEWCNTAKAARDLAAGTLAACNAVIASERCAELYGLEIMAQNIQDSTNNLTAFIVVKK